MTPFTPEELKAAVALAWVQELSRMKLSPDQMSGVEAMLFQIAFLCGAEWHVERTKRQLTTT